MEVRIGLLFLFLLVGAWACDARSLGDSIEKLDISVLEINYHEQSQSSEASRNGNVCALCEEYAAQALNYLSQNKTQNEIIEYLHASCSQLRSFEQQCITMVDYYTSIFFLEISSIQPEDLCKKVNLCQQIVMISSKVQEDSCSFCRQAVSELLVKLKDPDTELEIIETLLKVCNTMNNYVNKCKMMVFQYGPLILANAEKFLETTDMCTALHACNSSAVNSKEASATSLVLDA